MKKIFWLSIPMLVLCGCDSVNTGAATAGSPTPAATPTATSTGTPSPTAAPIPTPDWYWANPLPSGNSLYTAAFLDATHGLAAGDHGMLSSSDGGTTWEAMPLPPLAHIDTLQYTGPTTLVATGFNPPEPSQAFQPQSMTSEDGGLSWSLHSFPALPGLYMLDAHFDGMEGAAEGSWIQTQGQPSVPAITSGCLVSGSRSCTCETPSPGETLRAPVTGSRRPVLIS